MVQTGKDTILESSPNHGGKRSATIAQPKQPWGTVLWDSLSLLHPIVWWRVALFKRVDCQPLFYSTAAIAIGFPLFGGLYWFTSASQRYNRQQGGAFILKAVGCYLTSPWTLAWIWRAAPTVQKVTSAANDMLRAFSTTRPEAYQCLAHRIQQGRAYRTRGYDVYLPAPAAASLPPQSAITNSNTNPSREHGYCNSSTTTRCILFLTGVTVEHAAYASVTAQLSDMTTPNIRYLVVVVSAEPLRIVECGLPRFQPAALRRLQRSIEQRHCRPQTRGVVNNSNSSIGQASLMASPPPASPIEWILMGHSMGSLACTKLAATAQSLLHVKAVVMWGSAPFVDFMADISSLNLPVLVVQASNDAVIEAFGTPEMTRRFWSLLPNTTVRHTIKGGSTHSGFASYIPSWKPEVEDGGMDAAEQQRQAVEITQTFLSGLVSSS